MTHKKCNMPSDDTYHPLHVGRALSADLGYPGDDTGDNISDLNPLFGELTGLYWIWKNDTTSDAIGINHYRRYFMNDENKLMKHEGYEKLLSEYDLIATDLPEGSVTNYESFAGAHNIADYEQIGKSIQALCPEYHDSYTWFCSQRTGYYGNLCVMPRAMFMDYCDWMFGILFHASDHIDVSGYDLYHRRVYGFLSEALLNIWIHHNKLNCYECDVMYTSEKAETTELKKALGVLVKEGRIEDARSLYYDITKIRPDVLLPQSDISGELLIMEQILYIISEEQGQRITGLLSISDDLQEILASYRLFINNYTSSADHTDTPDFISPVALEVISRLYPGRS